MNSGLLAAGFSFDEVDNVQLGDAEAVANNISPEDHSPLYKTDEFRMYYMKVLPCSKRFVHDWTTCPFAHNGEKARRRDPRLFSYTGIACPDMKKTGNCIRADTCPYAHNVFEYWLHPTRYRTQLCNDGLNCTRRVCFFAHALNEVRVPKQKPYVSPEVLAKASLEALAAAYSGEGGCGSEALAPAAGSLYKSFSCPVNPAQLYGSSLTDQMRGTPVLSNLVRDDKNLQLLGMLGKVNENEPFALSEEARVRVPKSGGSQSSSTGKIQEEGEILNSLAQLKSALQTGKLNQETMLKMLAEVLIDTPAGADADVQQGSKDDSTVGRASSSASGRSLEGPGGDAEVLQAVQNPYGLWHTSSAPAGAIDRQRNSAAAAAAEQEWLAASQALAQAQAAESQQGSFNSKASTQQALDELLSATGGDAAKRAALEDLLQQNVQSGGDGNANQQALKRASSLTSWLQQKIKQSVGRGSGPTEEQLEQLSNSFSKLSREGLDFQVPM